MLFIRICMYLTGIAAPALLGYELGSAYPRISEHFLTHLVFLILSLWANARLYQERQEGRAILNHMFGFSWGWMVGLAAACSMIAGELLFRAFVLHDELSMGLGYMLVAAALACVEKAHEEGPSYGWNAWMQT